jgi:hypothetical protein
VQVWVLQDYRRVLQRSLNFRGLGDRAVLDIYAIVTDINQFLENFR